MSMQDPVADMLTRIRNAQTAGKVEVEMSSAKLKVALAEVLKLEGYIADYRVDEVGKKKNLIITLKYYQSKPVISLIRRVSKPGLRVYRNKDKLPKVMDGLGIAIISTSRGVMSDRKARQLGEGGEILCYVS
ncbi:MAG: 30S ribosomal protein S8 [Gammaproteobacteria bacterium]|nr:30S ribosomal protein S8 [Gammaproteobacteria bacterium]